MNRSKLFKKLAISLFCATGMLSGMAYADTIPAPTACSVNTAASGNAVLGKANTDDVTLNSAWATSCVFSNANPVAKPNGTTTGFANDFDTYTSTTPSTWSLLGKIQQNNDFTYTANDLYFTFSKTDKTWSVTNKGADAVTLDLVLAIHASNGSAAFLFDDQAIAAGQTLDGTWSIQWYNNKKNTNNPGFSNAAFFARDIVEGGSGGGEGGNVPEPGSLALMGLGMLGVMALRKRNKA